MMGRKPFSRHLNSVSQQELAGSRDRASWAGDSSTDSGRQEWSLRARPGQWRRGRWAAEVFWTSLSPRTYPSLPHSPTSLTAVIHPVQSSLTSMSQGLHTVHRDPDPQLWWFLALGAPSSPGFHWLPSVLVLFPPLSDCPTLCLPTRHLIPKPELSYPHLSVILCSAQAAYSRPAASPTQVVFLELTSWSDPSLHPILQPPANLLVPSWKPHRYCHPPLFAVLLSAVSVTHDDLDLEASDAPFDIYSEGLWSPNTMSQRPHHLYHFI